MIGLVRNEWKKVFLPVLLTTFADFTPQFWRAGSSMDYRIHAAAIHADNYVFCTVRMAGTFAPTSPEMSRYCRVLFL